MAGPVRISILTDTRDATRGFAKVSASAKSMGLTVGRVGSSIKGAFLAGGALLAASGIASGFKTAIDAGADLQAAMGTNKQIFKENSQALINWSENAADRLGVSQAEALNATKTFGAMFTGIGIGTKKAAGLSKEWSVMGANMAAFADLPTSDALDSISAALRGEMDPLQKYVPTVNAASVAQKAMELTGKKSAKTLTAQDKVLALNALLHDSVANKAGKAERAQGGYGVQMGKLKAQLTDTAAAIGSAFLPKITAIAKWINDKLIPAAKEFWATHGPALKSIFGKVGDAVGAVAKKAAPVLGFLSKFNLGIVGLITNADKIAPALEGFGKSDFGASMGKSLGSVGATLKSIATSPEATSIVDKIKAGFESLKAPVMKFVDTVRPILAEVAAFMAQTFAKYAPQIKATLADIGSVFSSIFEGIKIVITNATAIISFIWTNFGDKIKGVIGTAFGAVIAVFRGAFQIIKGIFDVVLGLLTGDWSRAWNGVKGVVRGVVTIVRGAVNAMQSVISLAMAVISKVLGAALNWIKAKTVSAFTSVKNFFVSVWNGIVSFLGGMLGRVKSAIGAAWSAVGSTTSSWWASIKTAVSNGVSSAVDSVRSLPGKVKGALTGAATWLYTVGQDIVRGMIEGVDSMVDNLLGTVRDLAGKAMSAAKKALGIGSPSKEFAKIGEDVVAGMAQGIKKRAPVLTKAGKSFMVYLKLGMVQGLTGAESKLASTMKSLNSKILSTFKTTYKTVVKGRKTTKVAVENKTQTRLIKAVDRANKALKPKARLWQRTVDSLAAKSAEVAGLRNARAEMVASVADTIRQSFTLVDQAAQDGDTSIRKILLRSGEAVRRAREFAAQLTELRQRNLSPAVLQELAAAGPEAGAATARSLQAATQQQLAELNDNYALIAASGAQAGDAVAGAFYDAGIAQGDGIIRGLRAAVPRIEAEMRAIAQRLKIYIQTAVKRYAVEPTKVTVKAPKKAAKKAAAKKTTKASVTAYYPGSAGQAVAPIYMTVNTGAVVDKRGLVDTVAAAVNEVAAQMGRPIKMAVAQ